MPLKTKNLRTAGQKSIQAARSERNKARRISRNKAKVTPSMNAAHRAARLTRRLKKLNAKFKDALLDKQPRMSNRIDEITKILAG